MTVDFTSFKGTYDPKTNHVHITQLTYGTLNPQSSEKHIVTTKLKNEKFFGDEVIKKTCDWGKRFFFGAVGTALPYAVFGVAQYYRSSETSSMINYPNGMIIAGAGLVTATVASKPLQAMKTGLLIGSTAVAITVLNQAEVRKAIVDSMIKVAKTVSETSSQVKDQVYGVGVTVKDFGAAAWEKTANCTSSAYQSVMGLFKRT